MSGVTLQNIQNQLGSLTGPPVRVLGLTPLAREYQEMAIKVCGYGEPTDVDYRIPGNLVLHTMRDRVRNRTFLR